MRNVEQLIRYGVFGGICTGINLLLFVLFQQLGMHYLLANTVSYAIAVVINFFLNKNHVFRGSGQSEKNVGNKFVRFMFVRVLSLAADNTLLYLVVSRLRMNQYVSKIVISIVLIVATYILNKLFVFHQNGERSSETNPIE